MKKSLSESQIKALRMVEKRNWPAGEPRIDWINKTTARKLVESGMIVIVEGTGTKNRGPIVQLTDAGRAVLAST